MDKISLRQFQLSAADYLDKLPLFLTRYDKVVAVVVSPDEYNQEKAPVKPLDGVRPEDIAVKVEPKPVEEVHMVECLRHHIIVDSNMVCPNCKLEQDSRHSAGLCRHGAAWDNCRYGCKNGEEFGP